MRVRDLIQKLNELNPELEVCIELKGYHGTVERVYVDGTDNRNWVVLDAVVEKGVLARG